MELLERLEERVESLLTRLDTLGRENSSLKLTNESELSALAEENDILRHALDDERAKNAHALKRIESIMERIKIAVEAEDAVLSIDRSANG